MVKRIYALSICLCLFVLAASNLVAETSTGIKTNLLSGYMHLDKTDFWYTSTNASLTIDSTGSSVVKGYCEFNGSFSSIPETAYTTSGYYGELGLNKLYAKIRLPFINDSSMRLSIGKMPLSWGYGLYYNSGDIIFGFDPSNYFTYNKVSLPFTSVCLKLSGENILSSSQNIDGVGLDSSSLISSTTNLPNTRTRTTWLGLLSLPFGESFMVDFIALPPLDNILNSDYGRFGGRIVYQPFIGFIESVEVGCLAQGDFKKIRSYMGLDGTIFFDYNLCTTALFDTLTQDNSNENIGFNKEGWNVSLSLMKNFTIQTDVAEHVLSFRTEGLFYPYNEEINIFCLLSYSPFDNTNVSVSSAISIKDYFTDNEKSFSCLSSMSFTWNVIQGLDLSVQGVLDCVDPENVTAIVVSFDYKY